LHSEGSTRTSGAFFPSPKSYLQEYRLWTCSALLLIVAAVVILLRGTDNLGDTAKAFTIGLLWCFPVHKRRHVVMESIRTGILTIGTSQQINPMVVPENEETFMTMFVKMIM